MWVYTTEHSFKVEEMEEPTKTPKWWLYKSKIAFKETHFSWLKQMIDHLQSPTSFKHKFKHLSA